MKVSEFTSSVRQCFCSFLLFRILCSHSFLFHDPHFPPCTHRNWWDRWDRNGWNRGGSTTPRTTTTTTTRRTTPSTTTTTTTTTQSPPKDIKKLYKDPVKPAGEWVICFFSVLVYVCNTFSYMLYYSFICILSFYVPTLK